MTPKSSIPIVSTHELAKNFGTLHAVRNVSLSIERGEIFGVLGPNGAGKSTTIRMLAGILKPSAGRGHVAGYDILAETEQIKASIGYMTQRFSLYEDISVRENLEFYAGIYGLYGAVKRARIQQVVEQTGLTDRTKQLTGTLSGGWKQRVALACATIHQPPLLFLDEPTAGVDPVSRRHFWDEIHRIASAGTTVLVTTHYMDEAERCHRLAFIFRGTLLDVGTPAEIEKRQGLSIAECFIQDAAAFAEACRRQPSVDEISHFGGKVRIATKGVDAVTLARDVALQLNARLEHLVPLPVTIEDAFVSMVHDDEARQMQGDLKGHA